MASKEYYVSQIYLVCYHRRQIKERNPHICIAAIGEILSALI